MKNKKIRALCESAILTAMALALSYLEIPIGFTLGGFGGSLSLVMIPLILCALRWGVGCGMLSGFIFGTLKYFFSNGFAITWESMLLDYSVAYMMLGIAGLLRGKSTVACFAALLGCIGRFAVHFVSGVTVYAAYVAPIFGWNGQSSAVYSLLYNGSYMLPNTILTVIAIVLLQKPLGKFLRRSDV